MQTTDDKRSSLDRSMDDEKPSSSDLKQAPFEGAGDGVAYDNTNAAPRTTVVLEKSRGVMKMELLMGRLNTKWLICLYAGFTVLAYTMSLDQYCASTYLTVATSQAFKAHSVLATVSTVKSVFQAVSQPPFAKMSDVFGRVETYLISVCLYTIGYIIVASSTSIYIYSVGNCIYILGITSLFLLQNIIISEISSLRNRIFWSIFPSIPGAINVWVSGNITESMLSHASWRWGYAMFTILVPVLSLPIIITLSLGMRRGKQNTDGLADDVVREVVVQRPRKSVGHHAKDAFWQLDLIGLLLLVGGFGVFLVAITLANSKRTTWSSPQSLAMLIVGAGASVLFVLWERFGAPHPVIPFKLLTNRNVIACLLINIFHPVSNGIAGGYLTTWLLVAANQSVTSATRLRNITSFTSLFSALMTGVLTRYFRYIKPFLVLGFCVEVLGLGLMIRFRQSTNPIRELIGVQIVRGIGSGMISFPTQGAIQSSSKHEHMAAITACSLLVYYLAGGVGSSIGGGIWTNSLPKKLDAYFTNSTLAASAYADPVTFIKNFKPGTAERIALARAQDETQRLMVTVATIVAAVGLVVSLFLQNIKLTDESTLAEIEQLDDYGDLTKAIRPASETAAKSSWLSRAWRF